MPVDLGERVASHLALGMWQEEECWAFLGGVLMTLNKKGMSRVLKREEHFRHWEQHCKVTIRKLCDSRHGRWS